MYVIRPQCRDRFTGDDIDFVVSVLGRDFGEADCIVELLADPDSRDLILDHDRLFLALLEHIGCLRVSTRFYFYVLVRRVFRQAGIHDRNTADYVAEMLSVFACAHRTRHPLPRQENPMLYAVDMLDALQRATPEERFLIHAHLGNFMLFLSGLFPRHIRHRRQRRAAPGIRYYEELGRTGFRLAGHHRLAGEYELEPVFATLSGHFHESRLALNDLAERLIAFDDCPAGWMTRS